MGSAQENFGVRWVSSLVGFMLPLILSLLKDGMARIGFFFLHTFQIIPVLMTRAISFLSHFVQKEKNFCESWGSNLGQELQQANAPSIEPWPIGYSATS